MKKAIAIVVTVAGLVGLSVAETAQVDITLEGDQQVSGFILEADANGVKFSSDGTGVASTLIPHSRIKYIQVTV